MNRNTEIIRRFDEVLLDKASKVSVQEVYEYTTRFLEKAPFMEHLNASEQRHRGHGEEMERMNDLIQTINENLNRESNVAVKKATTQVVKSMNPNGGNMLDANEIKNMMSGKVDRDELTALYDLKSNKLDTEMTMKSTTKIKKSSEQVKLI